MKFQLCIHVLKFIGLHGRQNTKQLLFLEHIGAKKLGSNAVIIAPGGHRKVEDG